MFENTSHPIVSLWLDVADKAIKLVAVVIGGLWTYWNYRKSRTYEQRLELEVSGTVFKQGDLYGDVKVVVKNIGGTRHLLQSAERSVNWPPFEPTWRNTWSGSFTSSRWITRLNPGRQSTTPSIGAYSIQLPTYFGSSCPCVSSRTE